MSLLAAQTIVMCVSVVAICGVCVALHSPWALYAILPVGLFTISLGEHNKEESDEDDQN